MAVLIAILGALFAIMSIIIIHELGHFWVARLFNIRVLRFSFGFGKVLWKRVTASGTEIAFSILPFGGYVKMFGEAGDVSSLTDEEKKVSFSHQPVLVRMAVVVAGPLINVLLALMAYWGVFLMGVTHVKPVIGSVIPHSIVARAGVPPGGEIVEVGGQHTSNWQDITYAFAKYVGDHNSLSIDIKSPKQGIKTYTLDLSSWHPGDKDPDFIGSLGVVPYLPPLEPIIGTIMPGSPAEHQGYQKGDRIISISNIPIQTWQEMVAFVRERPGQEVSVVLERNHHHITIKQKVGVIEEGSVKRGYLGLFVEPQPLPESFYNEEHFSIFSAWKPAFTQTVDLFTFNMTMLGKLLTGKLSVKSLGGPIAIAQAAGKASEAGLQIYLGFIAFVSLTVGFLNFLPIPGLDGGHLLFQCIELVIRRAVPYQVQMVGLALGFGLLILLMIQATINDLSRIFH